MRCWSIFVVNLPAVSGIDDFNNQAAIINRVDDTIGTNSQPESSFTAL